ncbi:MAG: group 1 glycosyl [Chitinophagaceae bacterium]|nr:MAG: group 1 glycosyl [Chitinophagaceae bacterium]
MQRIIFTVTNNLSFDQRMHRIAHSLSAAGYQVLLVGRNTPGAPALPEGPFQQKRLPCFFQTGPLFYLEFNFRLLLFLLFEPVDIICAIDLDTILPCLMASSIRGKKRVYDAHEYFTQQKELIRRPGVQRIWLAIEKWAVPQFPNGYTVNAHLAQLFKENYGVNYEIVRNICFHYPLENTDNQSNEKFILYQGAVNEGRCFEQLIPAMKWVDAPLFIVGGGNFMDQTIKLIRHYKLENKVFLKGCLQPQVYSLANRFFDYMMAGVPQICVNYPLYKEINDQYGFAYLVDDTHPLTIGDALNKLLKDGVVYKELKQNCLNARKELHWDKEAENLIHFYNRL